MARTVSSASARSVITVLSEAVIDAAPLPTGLYAIRVLVMGSTPPGPVPRSQRHQPRACPKGYFRWAKRYLGRSITMSNPVRASDGEAEPTVYSLRGVENMKDASPVRSPVSVTRCGAVESAQTGLHPPRSRRAVRSVG